MHVLLLPNQIDHKAELQPIEENNKNHADRTDSDTDFDTSDKMSPLPEWVMDFNQINKLCNKIYLYLANPKGLDKPNAYLKGLRVENSLLMKGNQLWVANKGQLQLDIIKKIYNQPAVGHSSTKRMLEMAQCHYY